MGLIQRPQHGGSQSTCPHLPCCQPGRPHQAISALWLSYRQKTMAEFSQKRGKRRDDEVLGSAVDFLLANARLVLGVGGAAVLGIATLAVKRVRPAWAGYTWGSQRRMTGLGPAARPQEVGRTAQSWHLFLYPSNLVGFALSFVKAA